MESAVLRPLDLVVIICFLGVCIGIGVYCARRSKSADSYFLAGRKMPGWVVGFSLMATLISSMTFMAAPGFAYAKDWRYLPCNFLFVFSIFLYKTAAPPAAKSNNHQKFLKNVLIQISIIVMNGREAEVSSNTFVIFGMTNMNRKKTINMLTHAMKEG